MVRYRLRHRSHPNDNSSVSTRSKVLPLLSQLPSARPAANHQLSRIYGPTAPRDVPTQSSWIQPGIDTTVGDSIHPHTSDSRMQQQMINRFVLPIPRLQIGNCRIAGPICRSCSGQSRYELHDYSSRYRTGPRYRSNQSGNSLINAARGNGA